CRIRELLAGPGVSRTPASCHAWSSHAGCSMTETPEIFGREVAPKVLDDRHCLRASAPDVAHLVHAHSDSGWQLAEIGNLIVLRIRNGWHRSDQRTLDRFAVEDVHLVALRVLSKGNFVDLPAIATDPCPADPGEDEIACSQSSSPNVNGTEWAKTDAAECVLQLHVCRMPDIPFRWAETPVERQSDITWRHVDPRESLSDEHERCAWRHLHLHRTLGSRLTAQQACQFVCRRRNQLCRSELQYLPFPGRIANRSYIGASQHLNFSARSRPALRKPKTIRRCPTIRANGARLRRSETPPAARRGTRSGRGGRPGMPRESK